MSRTLSKLAVLIVVAYTAIVAQQTSAAPPADDKPLDVAPVARSDSRLFVTYAVEDVYRSFPTADAPAAALAAWVSSTKADLERLQKEARRAVPDEDLDRMVRDVLAAVQAYETFLVNLGAIERGAVARKGQDAFMNGYDSGRNAREFYDGVRARGGSSDDALGGAIVVGLVDFLVRDYNAKQAREAARDRAAAAETRKLRDAVGEAVGRAPVLARKLRDRHDWTTEETPFAAADGAKLNDLVRRQPRNPFVLAAYANVRVRGETADDLMGDARRCLEACRLVPEAHTTFRVRFMTTAATLASRAAMAELGAKGFSGAPGRLAPEAVRYWRTVEALGGGKLSGFEHWKLSEALACAGRYQDGLDAANKALDWSNRTRNDVFAYNYVCLSCLAGGDSKLDLKNLRVAFERDPRVVSLARTDPDLARLRREQAGGFSELVKVKADYRLVYGVFNDDVKMTNNSAFALTDVVVEARFEQNGKVWTRRLTTPIVRPGETYTWSACVSIPGSRVSAWYAKLSCDQDR